jgi:hypothetical protein
MSNILEAIAVIKGKDATGNAFDQVAGKIKNVASAAKALDGIKPLGRNFQRDLADLRATEKELALIARSFKSFDAALKSRGPIRASAYFGAIDQWKSHTLAALREVRGGLADTERVQARFFRRAGHFALGAVGIYGGTYAAEHAIRSAARSAADRQRERVRYDQMGFNPAEQADANVVADRLALAYPSISRTEHLADLRKNASRLGGFDRAKEIADIYARAKIANAISGGDTHELEQLVRAAEGAGAANTAGQFGAFLNAFARAKAANPDYTGEEFAKDFRAAGAAKYGFGRDFMEADFPVLASHTPGFGVKLATANSALIGSRATKASKNAMRAAGLLDGNGRLVDTAGYQNNPFEWVQRHIRPILEAQGVKFGEHMSEDDKRTTAAWATRTFSAKNAADLVLSMLLDAPLVERARQRRTKDLDSIPDLQSGDAYLAQEAVKKQLGDFATALIGLRPVIDLMNGFARSVGRLTNEFSEDTRPGQQAGRVIGGTMLASGAAVGGVLAARGAYQWFTGAGALSGSAVALNESAAALTAAAARLAASGGGSFSDSLKPGGSAGRKMPVVPLVTALTAPLFLGGDTPEGGDILRKQVERDTERFQRGRDFTLGSNRTFGFGSSSSFERFTPPAFGGGILGYLGNAAGHFNYQDVPVKAQVEGNATLDVRVVVDSSPDFWANVDRRISNHINVFRNTGVTKFGTSGSTGMSWSAAEPGAW